MVLFWICITVTCFNLGSASFSKVTHQNPTLVSDRLLSTKSFRNRHVEDEACGYVDHSTINSPPVAFQPPVAPATVPPTRQAAGKDGIGKKTLLGSAQLAHPQAPASGYELPSSTVSRRANPSGHTPNPVSAVEHPRPTTAWGEELAPLEEANHGYLDVETTEKEAARSSGRSTAGGQAPSSSRGRVPSGSTGLRTNPLFGGASSLSASPNADPRGPAGATASGEWIRGAAGGNKASNRRKRIVVAVVVALLVLGGAAAAVVVVMNTGASGHQGGPTSAPSAGRKSTPAVSVCVHPNPNPPLRPRAPSPLRMYA